MHQDPSTPIQDRVASLLDRMTLEEKLAQLGSAWVFEVVPNGDLDEQRAEKLLGVGIGQVSRIAGASAMEPHEVAAMANRVQRYLVEETRLGIPAIVHEECLSGYMARRASCFPQPLGVAATFDVDLAEQLADVTSRQMRAAGAHQGLAPVLDVARDPRWGRIEETFGEDPYLVAAMGCAVVRGLQGADLQTGVVATGKHFVGYGQPEAGMNWAPAHIGARELADVYLFPFEAAVRENGLASIMNAYHELDGVPCVISSELLTDVLRGAWEFDGIVVSDYFAITELTRSHANVRTLRDAAVRTLSAGLDVELPSTAGFGAPLHEAVSLGELDVSVVDRAVAAMLRTKLRLGLFDDPYVDADAVTEQLDTEEDRRLARRAAMASLTLVRNEGSVLPLDPGINRIALIGPHADDGRLLVGDYAYIAHNESLLEAKAGADGGDFGISVPSDFGRVDDWLSVPTVLESLRAAVADGTTVQHARGCGVNDADITGFDEAVAAASESDVAVVVLGERSGLTDDCTTGEARDRTDLGLSGVQQQLLEAVHATGTPVVLVVVSGRPLALEWAAEHVPAILYAWVPGEEGGPAIADVLTGRGAPGGKLPVSVPRHVGQVPIFYGHKPSGGRSHWKGAYVDRESTPLWPFGHGLAYTSFALSDLSVSSHQVAADGAVRISAEVANTGGRAGDEVVQLYLGQPGRSVTQPVKQLAGFARVSLAPGERRRVTFTVAVPQLSFTDRTMRLVVEPGTVEVMVGTSSTELPLRGGFEITGEALVVRGRRPCFTAVEVTEA